MVHADDLSVCGTGPSQYFKESNVVLYSFPDKFKIVSRDPSPMMRKPCLREKLCLILNGGIFVWSSRCFVAAPKIVFFIRIQVLVV